MHDFKIYIAILFGILMTLGCTELENSPLASDDSPPGQVTNIEVQTIPGGAYITYQLPDDPDLLYVKGTYEIREGEIAEQLHCTMTPSKL